MNSLNFEHQVLASFAKEINMHESEKHGLNKGYHALSTAVGDSQTDWVDHDKTLLICPSPRAKMIDPDIKFSLTWD